MPGLDDLELDRTPSSATQTSSRLLPGAIVVIVLVALAGAWYYLQRRADHLVSVEQKNVVAQPVAQEPVKASPDLPPLDSTDALVRELVSALSQHPIVAAWLTTDGLIRTFAVSVANVANGETPAGHLATIKPESRFRVRQQGSRLYLDPRSYSRFDGHAAAVAALDPEGVARVYARLKPRIEEAYREVAGANASVDHGLERAIAELLATPIVEGNVALEVRPVGYHYADPSLESLSNAQKQLLRMGPANVRLVQQELRLVAEKLGLDATKLPRERVIRTGS